MFVADNTVCIDVYKDLSHGNRVHVPPRFARRYAEHAAAYAANGKADARPAGTIGLDACLCLKVLTYREQGDAIYE